MKAENADDLRKAIEESIKNEMPEKFQQKSGPMNNMAEVISC